MIPTLLVIGAIAMLLGVPALVGPVKSLKERRAQARRQRETAKRENKERAQRLQQEHENLWRHKPLLAVENVLVAYLGSDQTRLRQHVARALRWLERRTKKESRRIAEARSDRPVTLGYRILVIFGATAWVVVSLLAVGLDYLIFRGQHPHSLILFPLGLAMLMVLGVTVGALVMFSVPRYHVLSANTSAYVRRVVMAGGILLAFGIPLYMVQIAPQRSEFTGQATIVTAKQAVADAKTTVPFDQNALDQKETTLRNAKASLARAQATDRWSVVVLAALEIPLTEAAVLGGELLLLYWVSRRREAAEDTLEHAKDARERADNGFLKHTTNLLAFYGHGPELIAQAQAMINAAFAAGGVGVLPPPSDVLPEVPPPANGDGESKNGQSARVPGTPTRGRNRRSTSQTNPSATGTPGPDHGTDPTTATGGADGSRGRRTESS